VATLITVTIIRGKFSAIHFKFSMTFVSMKMSKTSLLSRKTSLIVLLHEISGKITMFMQLCVHALKETTQLVIEDFLL
jgi:hypothetical protein